MRVETERLYLYPISNDEMRSLIEKQADAEMKQAYTEMLEGCLLEPDSRIWYAVWNMELKNVPGTIVGDFCFKGLGKDGVVEIGYGLREEFRHQQSCLYMDWKRMMCLYRLVGLEIICTMLCGFQERMH
jgi:RimJ/RimL family protein N-acetyltransferase